MTRTRTPVADRKQGPRSSADVSRAAAPRRGPVPRPPRRHKVLLATTIVLLTAWMGFLVWLAYHAWWFTRR
jgi:hypothetical protein